MIRGRPWLGPKKHSSLTTSLSNRPLAFINFFMWDIAAYYFFSHRVSFIIPSKRYREEDDGVRRRKSVSIRRDREITHRGCQINDLYQISPKVSVLAPPIANFIHGQMNFDSRISRFATARSTSALETRFGKSGDASASRTPFSWCLLCFSRRASREDGVCWFSRRKVLARLAIESVDSGIWYDKTFLSFRASFCKSAWRSRRRGEK